MKDIRVGANIWGLLNRERGSGLHHVEIRSAGPGIYLLAVCKRISMTVHTYYIVFTNFDISRPQYLYTWSGRLTSTILMSLCAKLLSRDSKFLFIHVFARSLRPSIQ